MANPFSLSRVFRFTDAHGAAQIADFPDGAPNGGTDIEVRMKHFTEIENFTFLGYVLAHELERGQPAFPVRTLINLEVPDPEFKARLQEAQGEYFTNEQLGDAILDLGINWEHFVASFNAQLIPGDPLVITDTVIQRKIDSLDILTEALVREVNLRSVEAKLPKS